MSGSQRNLKVIGDRLAFVDDIIVQMLAARHRLSLEVSAIKRADGQPIYRHDVEIARINKASQYGATFGLKPEFVAGIMYQIIRESCMDQIIDREGHPDGPLPLQSYETQKANLLELTRLIATSYDVTYHLPFATKLYDMYEDAQIENLVLDRVPRERRRRFLDLGCGTGKVAIRFGNLFDSVVGYDLSPHMLDIARQKKAKTYAERDISFVEMDLENGLQEPDGSVSFVVMTLGTASDIKNIEHVIAETLRVLEPGGRFLFSFYNADALLYQWQYLPWQMSLAARVNFEDHCLEVPHSDKIFQIYARPYTVDEVGHLFRGIPHGVVTYPTISSIIPNEAFVGQPTERIVQTVTALDRQLSYGHHGAYIIVTGTKSDGTEATVE